MFASIKFDYEWIKKQKVDFGNGHSDIQDVWKVTIRYKGKQLTSKFFTGSQYGSPNVKGFLYSLFMDAIANDYTFEQWCNEYGYEGTSKERKIYDKYVKTHEKLVKLFGDDIDKFRKSLENY